MAKLGHHLLVEWVPKADERTQWLLANREDVFEHYNQTTFESAFTQHFAQVSKAELGTSGRTLYHFTRKA